MLGLTSSSAPVEEEESGLSLGELRVFVMKIGWPLQSFWLDQSEGASSPEHLDSGRRAVNHLVRKWICERREARRALLTRWRVSLHLFSPLAMCGGVILSGGSTEMRKGSRRAAILCQFRDFLSQIAVAKLTEHTSRSQAHGWLSQFGVASHILQLLLLLNSSLSFQDQTAKHMHA